jgi:hypothetical protein
MKWDPFSITMRDGGGTFNAADLSPANLTSGYAVAVCKGTAVAIRPDSSAFALPVDLVEQAMAYVALSYDSPYVGTWYDAGVIRIDPVMVTRTKWFALSLAEAYEQESIYDFANKEVIYVASK